MMNYPITTTTILNHCESEYADVKVVSNNLDDKAFQYNYADFARRSCQLANSLIHMGIKPGDRVATMAWNTHQHLELYYAIAGIGAICHTINPRYSLEQINYIVGHAQDKALFYDIGFSAIVEKLVQSNTCVESFISLNGQGQSNTETSIVSIDYEDLISSESEEFIWPQLEENSSSSLCYTSGTTGNPKGVVYTHRSTFLHAMMASQRDALDISSVDTVCPIVPMFHVNAWGIPYMAPLTGASLVLPGAKLQAKALFDSFNEHKVTVTAGVPTILDAMLKYMQELNAKPDGLHTVIIGGAAPSMSMIRDFEQGFGLRVLHGWGMTESSPLVTISSPKPVVRQTMDVEQQLSYKEKQGRKLFGVEMKLVNDEGEPVPHDGESSGRLLIRGAWIVDRYYGEDKAAYDKDGWFDTGDISTIDEQGYMQIVDRSKDVIKSGGEWISSVQMENVALAHPQIDQAAVIGIPHPKWLERPLLIVVPKNGTLLSKTEICSFLGDRIPKWWLPEEIRSTNSLPIGATGKIQKNILREEYSNFESLAD